MESTFAMIIHGFVITIILYVILRFLFKQPEAKSVDRSVLIGLLSAAYMIIFGHNLPTHINGNLLL